mgnify:CR=1 FL=1
MRYAIVIEQAGGNYSAYVPDLPGCPFGGIYKGRSYIFTSGMRGHDEITDHAPFVFNLVKLQLPINEFLIHLHPLFPIQPTAKLHSELTEILLIIGIRLLRNQFTLI